MTAGTASADTKVLGLLDTADMSVKITDASCRGHADKKQLGRAIATLPDGRFVWGCWAIVGGSVMMVFENGDQRMFPITAFRDVSRQGGATK